MKKFRHFARLSLSLSLLPSELNFCTNLTPKKSKMRKFPTKGLKKCFQLIWFVCLYGTMNWKSKEPSERINKLYVPKQVIRKTITNYAPLKVAHIIALQNTFVVTSYLKKPITNYSTLNVTDYHLKCIC